VRQVTRILVIEDDRPIRDLFREVLGEEGYDLLFIERLDHAEAGAAPDLVITDLEGLRPYASGPAGVLVGRIQKRFPSTPIIVCTAYEQAMEESDRLGATALLIKPFTIDELVQIVARVAAG
jgi:DNA-binding NtrC family response regulator